MQQAEYWNQDKNHLRIHMAATPGIHRLMVSLQQFHYSKRCCHFRHIRQLEYFARGSSDAILGSRR